MANVMKELALMQMRYGLSILVIADTKSKRSANVLFDYAESDIDMNPPKPEKKPRKASAKKDTTEANDSSVETTANQRNYCTSGSVYRAAPPLRR